MTPEPRDLTERRVEAIARVMGVYGQRLAFAYVGGTAIPPEFYADIIAADPVTLDIPMMQDSVMVLQRKLGDATALLERAAEVLTDVRRELCGVPFGSEHAIDALLTELRARAG